APAWFAIWPLIASIVIKSFLAMLKMRTGRRIHSSGLTADAWHDGVDVLSSLVALIAVSLSLQSPESFAAADHWGGFAVGLIVVFLGIQVARETTLQLMDTMTDDDQM